MGQLYTNGDGHIRSASAIPVVRIPITGDSLPGGGTMVVRAMLEERLGLYAVWSPVMDTLFGGRSRSYVGSLPVKVNLGLNSRGLESFPKWFVWWKSL